MVKTYTENPSFSNKKNLEETEQLLDEVWLFSSLFLQYKLNLETTV